jgi:hypothetical protein
MAEITDLTGLAKVADSELARQIYSDGLQRATKETGEFLGALSKTARSVVQPILTALQGASLRLDTWVAEAVSQVPPERLAPANPAILAETIRRISIEADDSQMRAFYVKLLASLMDREVQPMVRPLFTRLLAELSPGDALLFQICAPPGRCQQAVPQRGDAPHIRLSDALGVSIPQGVEGQVHLYYSGVIDDRARASPEVGVLELVPAAPLAGVNVALSLLMLQRAELIRKVAGWWENPSFHAQLWGASTTSFYSRTALGIPFARCCVPEFDGVVNWHWAKR